MRRLRLGVHQPHAAMPKLAVISLGVLLLLLAPLATGDDVPQIRVALRSDAAGPLVRYVDPGTPAWQAGLRTGDVILAVNGVRLQPHSNALSLSHARALTLLRRGRVIRIRKVPLQAGDGLFLLIVALAFWVIAVYAGARAPRDPLVRRVYWLSMAMGVALGLSTAADNDVSWAKVPEIAAYAAMPALFFSTFRWVAIGSRPTGRSATLAGILYVVGGSIATAYSLVGLATGKWLILPSDLLLALLVIGFGAGLASLLHARRHPLSSRHRSQVSIILLGAAVAVLPFAVLSIVPWIVGKTGFPPQITALAEVFLPLALVYAMIRHQFLGIRLVVQRTLLYGLMTVVFAGCYAVFLYGLERVGLGAHSSQPLLWVAYLALVTITFASIRDALRTLIDRLIYRDRFNRARVLRDLGARLASVQPLDEVLASITETLTDATNLGGAAILLRQEDGTFTVRAAAGKCEDAGLTQQLAWRAGEQDGSSGGAHWVKLTAHGELCGLLYLGPNRVQGDISADDMTLVETLANQAAVAVANTLLVDRLRTKVAEMELLRDQLLHVQDEERKRLAQELHDGALHAVWGLVRQASGSASALSANGADGPSRFHGLAELCQDIAYQLRETCSHLYPSELGHLGLSAALQKLADTTSMDEEVAVRLAVDGEEDFWLPTEMQEPLYRVAREAISNVVRHSHATIAEITLDVQHAHVTLTVRDNGSGFTVPPTGSLIRRGHLGLVGMRERVESLGGLLTVTAKAGEGTEVKASLEIPRDAEVPAVELQHVEV